jgi:RNA polymerase sigma-54 factor
MTPQLREAISLLQLSNIELSEYLDKELDQNPFLEKDDSARETDTAESYSASVDTADAEAQSKAIEKQQREKDDSDYDAAQASYEYNEESASSNEGNAAAEDYSGDAYDASGSGDSFAGVGAGGNSKFENSEYSFENRISDEKSLREHLTEQINLSIDDQRDRMIAAMMIDYLDETGYLRFKPQELSEKLGCSLERVENLLPIVRDFDPVGIFAYDLPDCLALQLKDINRYDPAIEKLLQNLNKLAEGDLKGLSRICGVDIEDIQDMVMDIRRLNPRPASNFDHIVVQTVVPDVLMSALPKHVGGGWKVVLNNDTLPRALVNNDYEALINSKSTDKKDKKYMNDQLASASWLVRALDQRAQTILKVAAEIVEQQDGFFLYGVEFLRPLTLREVAEVVGVHESTVSRVTMNKYIGTPRGLFELKYFFDSGVSGAGGVAHSAEAVKARIKSLIGSETADSIYSDDGLAEELQKEGIDIARRTVAKYREALNIPSSPMRRKQKKNALS